MLVERQVCHQVLQPAILVLELLESLGFAHGHPAVLRPPAVERLGRDPQLAAKLAHPYAAFGLLEGPDDLLLAESSLAHRVPRAVSALRRTVTLQLDQLSGRGSSEALDSTKGAAELCDILGMAPAEQRFVGWNCDAGGVVPEENLLPVSPALGGRACDA